METQWSYRSRQIIAMFLMPRAQDHTSHLRLPGRERTPGLALLSPALQLAGFWLSWHQPCWSGRGSFSGVTVAWTSLFGAEMLAASRHRLCSTGCGLISRTQAAAQGPTGYLHRSCLRLFLSTHVQTEFAWCSSVLRDLGGFLDSYCCAVRGSRGAGRLCL